MDHSEMVLAKIRCQATDATLSSMLSTFGIQVRGSRELHEFDLVSGTRGTEPEVNSEIVALAFEALRRAEEDGHLVGFAILPTGSIRN